MGNTAGELQAGPAGPSRDDRAVLMGMLLGLLSS